MNVDQGVKTLAKRKALQLESIKKAPSLFYDFHFTDHLTESGITFINKAVDDTGKYYKPVHYDHGNGLAVADVDNDGLLDVYFCTQLGSNQLWKNLGDGKFENITGNTALENRISVAASFADIDNDGDEDLYVTNVRKGNVLFENDGKGKFKDISKESHLDYVGHSSGAVFFDYDNDGLLDLFLVNIGKYTSNEVGTGGYNVGIYNAFEGHLNPELSEPSVLFKNDGKHQFTDVSQKVNLVDKSWSGDASFADFNNDLYPDLYVLNMQGDNHYYENQRGKSFIDKSRVHFPKTPWGAMGIKFFDYDNDGLMDLFLTDMHSDMSHEIDPPEEKEKSIMTWSKEVLNDGSNSIFGNAFYKNAGKGKFVEISDKIGTENYWPWGISVGDLNADGYDDVFITSGMGFPLRYGINTVLLNQKGIKFWDSEFVLGVEPRKDGRTDGPVFDVDCSGTDKIDRYCKNQTGTVVVYGTLSSRSSAIFDLDNDGDLDIITNELNAPLQVLISDLEKGKKLSFLKVKLVGTKSNKNGLGALVKVIAGKNIYTKYNDGKSGYLSQSAAPLYFGLANSTGVDRIEVLWPSGEKQILKSPIALNRVLTVQEP